MIIQRCIEIKSEIVNQDEKDLSDKRSVLNYGHTFGHAIEAVTGYRTFLHGEAVSIGMNCAADLSIELGMCDPILKEKQKRLCQRANLPIQLPYLPIEHLIAKMKSDKKKVMARYI